MVLAFSSSIRQSNRMSAPFAANGLQLWAEGSHIAHICNVDAQMMPHYKIQAVCIQEGCEEIIPFTLGLARDVRKHFNEKHRLLCKACKKEDFTRKEDLEEHLKSYHGDSFCSECHTSFNLTSAIAMHIENPKNSCSVTPQALASALRRIQADVKDWDIQNNGIVPNAVLSPISCGYGDIQCSPEGIMFRKLKEFRRTLLRAHKEALSHKQQETMHPPSPASRTLSVHRSSHYLSGYGSPHDSVLQSGLAHGKVASGLSLQDKTSGIVQVKGIGCSGCAVPPSSLDPKSPNGSSNHDSPWLRDDQDRFEQENWEWTCVTCMLNFTTLSKLLQHVEARVKDSWWKSMNK